MTQLITKDFSPVFKEMGFISIVTALSYYAGYVSWTSFYRLLGIESEGQALDYLIMGADFYISTVLDTLRFVIYSPWQALSAFFSQDLLWASASLCISLICFVSFRQFFPKKEKWYWLCYGGLVISVFFVLKLQANSLELNGLLQIPAEDIFTKYENTDEPPCDRNYAIYNGYISDLQLTNPEKHTLIARYFNMLSTGDNAHERFKLYVTVFLLLLLQTVLFLALGRQVQLPGARWAIVPLIFSFMLLPTTYGIFGRSFSFPYVTLDITEKDKIIRTHAVYLIRQTEKQVCVYDKLNFFQIKYLPREKLKSSNQLFLASPFDYSITNQAPICDSLYFLPQNQSPFDF